MNIKEYVKYNYLFQYNLPLIHRFHKSIITIQCFFRVTTSKKIFKKLEADKQLELNRIKYYNSII